MVQQVKDLPLPLQWLGLLLWRRFKPWPGNFHMLQEWPKKKKKKERKKSKGKETDGLLNNNPHTRLLGL